MPRSFTRPATVTAWGEDLMAIEPSASRGFAEGRASWPAKCGAIEWSDEGTAQRGSVAMLRIYGPLSQYGGWWSMGYDEIAEHFDRLQASADNKAILLHMHTPGGYLSGLDECVSAMLASKAKHGKPVGMVSADMCYSAGAWLSTVADKGSMFATRMGGTGSIGVRVGAYDLVKMNEMLGINAVVITSGPEKADGDPDVALTAPVIERFQGRVDYTAGIFYEAVERCRGGVSDEVKRAGVFLGPAGVAAGLIDDIKSVDESIAHLEQRTSGRVISTPSRTGQARQGQSGKAHSMTQEMLALALGLASSATDQEITGAAQAFRDLETKVREKTGEASVKEALATIDAWKANSAALQTAKDELAAVRQREESAAYQAAIAKAESEGKIVGANRAQVLATYTDSAALAAWSKTVLAAIPGGETKADKKPGDKPSAETADGAALTHNGKTWAQMSRSEQAALHNENHALYEQMREGAKR